MLQALVHPEDILDRDSAVPVLNALFGKFPFLKTFEMADVRVENSRTDRGGRWRRSRRKRLSEVNRLKALGLFRDAGSWRAHLHDWDDAAGSPKVAKILKR